MISTSLKIYLDAPSEYELKNEMSFIYRCGQINCKYLKFKDANSVIKIMNDFDKDALTKEDKEFILKNSNKKVLVHISRVYGEYYDCFVFGNDHIAFRLSCFV